MMGSGKKLMLVGDNPFQGVSHLSRDKAMQRDKNIVKAKFAAELVVKALANGAGGFTFTLNDTTLAILNEIKKSNAGNIALYPLVPDVGEMVRIAGSAGGIPGLAKEMAKRLVLCLDGQLVLNLAAGVLLNKPVSLLRGYLRYEYRRLRRAAGENKLKTIMLHEIVTDMALGLDMEWLFRAHIELMGRLGLQPGFETRNLPYLVKQIKKWRLDPAGMIIEAPFNAAGFQMYPSRRECENALEYLKGKNAAVIAIGALAAGYLKPAEALAYVFNLEGLGGVAVGVSSAEQAVTTFSTGRELLIQADNANKLINN